MNTSSPVIESEKLVFQDPSLRMQPGDHKKFSVELPRKFCSCSNCIDTITFAEVRQKLWLENSKGELEFRINKIYSTTHEREVFVLWLTPECAREIKKAKRKIIIEIVLLVIIMVLSILLLIDLIPRLAELI